MEWVDQILILGVIEWLLNIDINLHYLVVVSGKHDAVISTGQSHTSDPRAHNARHQFRIFTLFFLFTLWELSNLHVRVFGVL